MWVSLILAALFIFCGILFRLGKGASLIAGYNTLSEEEKAQYNTPYLMRIMSNAMFLYALIMIFWAYEPRFESQWPFLLSIGVFLLITIVLVTLANTKAKQKK